MPVLLEATVKFGKGHRAESVRGTPPRRREGRIEAQAGPRPPRNTPASAGRTGTHRPHGASVTEHPRVGGKDCFWYAAKRAASGTPPRRREGHQAGHLVEVRQRNTPASAGRTCGTPRPSTRSTEHPRVGGKDSARTSATSSPRGTPPRRREGLDLRGPGGVAVRNTPASAGRTLTPTHRPEKRTEHPRVGGKDGAPDTPGGLRCGTPPRRREGLAQPVLDLCVRLEHPRVGGKDPTMEESDPRRTGTPPRRREGREPDEETAEDLRNTPASAGRTAGPGRRAPASPEHPRVGGKDAPPLRVFISGCGTPPRRREGPGRAFPGPPGRRNTPASAGRTASVRQPVGQATEHPRVGGKDAHSLPVDPDTIGTPPRRREGRLDVR